MDVVSYALSKKVAASAVSGVKSMSVSGQTLIINTKDSGVLTMTFPTPKDAVSVTDIDVNEKNQIVFTMSDGTKITSGTIPTVKGDKLTFDDLSDAEKELLKGIDGNPGFSPIVTILESTGRHTVSITDKDGVKSFVVKDGLSEDMQNYYTKDEVNKKIESKVDISDIPTIPTNVSELNNDENYIKNTVDNLVNYYSKADTYSQTEVNTLLANLNKLTSQIVTELPTENIDSSIIYLIEVEGQSNVYMQYMYINGTFASLGTTAIDLSNVYTKSEINTKLDEKADRTEIPTVPKNISSLVNDAGYLTGYTETDPTVPAWAKEETKPSYTAAEVGALPEDTEIPVFVNKEVLDKFSESDTGEILYDGESIKGSGAGTSVSIAVDKTMSDTSTNPVQNKVVKKYIDDKSVEVSNEENNAIIEKTDGIFVEDKSSSIQKIQDKLNLLNIAQHTVNSQLEYCYCKLGNTGKNDSIKTNDIMKFTPLIKNGLEYNSANYSILLKKGKIYKISADMQCNIDSNGGVIFTIYNLTKSEELIHFYKTTMSRQSESSASVIYTADADNEEIAIKVKKVVTNATLADVPTDYCWFIVEEIGRSITIDPVEYINKESGIEDAPIGEIISRLGNTVPKHYLLCNGKEYNITDYPDLAQYFINEFGQSNYFGGDGETTFAVPQLTDKTVMFRPIVMTSNTTPSPLVASASSIHTETGTWDIFHLFDNSKTTSWHNNYTREGVDGNEWVQLDFGRNTNVSAFRILGRSGSVEQAPKNIKLLGSYDGVNFDEIAAYSNLSFSANTYKEFILDSIYDYKIYRVSMSGGSRYTANTNVYSISQIEFGVFKSITAIKYEPTYFMKNTYNADNVYSTDEMIVGKWIDGKPLYRKTIDCGALPNSTTKTIAHNITDIGEIVKINGVATNESSDLTINLPHITSSAASGASVMITATSVGIRISSPINLTAYSKSYVTLEYTKS